MVFSRFVLAGGLALAAAFPAAPAAADFILESPNLRLSVTADATHYNFSVTDRTTGSLLLAQSAASFNGLPVVGAGTPTPGADGGRPYLQVPLLLQGGGTATAKFTLTDADALRVDLSGAGVTSIRQAFADQGERFYGAWQTTYGKNLNNRGLSRPFYGKFEDIDSDRNEGARAPFFLTSRNVGVYAQTKAAGDYQFAATAGTGAAFSFSTGSLSYHILRGDSPKDVLEGYHAVAGAAFMPPDWAFDAIWWRDDHHQIPSQAGVSTAQALVLKDAELLRQYHIPASGIWLDRPYGTGSTPSAMSGWGNFDFDPAAFPNVPQLIADLDAGGMNLLVWIANRGGNSLLTEAAARGYLCSSSLTSPAIDLRNPAAYAWFKAKLDTFVNLGIKGYKIDRGGEGEMPDSVNNQMVTLFHQLAYEGMQARHGSDFFNFARDLHDDSRQYAAVWNGDPRADFAGLATSVKNGIRAGLINFPMWGSDTGGYIGAPTKEVWARWFAFSAYTPMMEVLQNQNRNVWYNYDGELLNIAVKHSQTHHDLIPYVRSLVYEATQTGVPAIRAMFLEFPGEAAAADLGDQYMYGPNLLVAPVVTSGVSSRSVYLPAGRWLDYLDKEGVVEGGRSLVAAAPLGDIPVFVREGAIVPRGDIVEGNQNVAGWKPGWQPHLDLEVFPSEIVDGLFDYYTGAGMETITAQLRGLNLLLDFGDLGVPGDVELYLGRFFDFEGLAWIRRNGQVLAPADYSFDAGTSLLTIPFSGATHLVIGLIPEPATLTLLGLTGVGLLRRRRPA